ncbi:MAG: RNA polymerase sigma factor, partial [Planctomycetota bacterium]
MPDKSETRLVEAACNGDIESFGELCRRYYPAMVAIGYSVLTDHQLAEDAAQESFARALTKLQNLRNIRKFVPWLAAICRNVAKDMAMANTRIINTDDLSKAAQNNNPEESRKLIRLAIEQLPVSDKELIVLRF